MADAIRREYLLDHAILAGKFPVQRRQHWQQRYDRDPVGTEQVLAALAPIVTGAQVSPYPREMFPELDRQPRRQRAGASAPSASAAHVSAAAPLPPTVAAGDDLTPEVVAAWSRELFPEAAYAEIPRRVTRAND
jgi:hypothetical protein